MAIPLQILLFVAIQDSCIVTRQPQNCEVPFFRSFRRPLQRILDREVLGFSMEPLTFRRIPATAGQCPFHLFNEGLLATERFHQYLIKQSWEEHLQGNFRIERRRSWMGARPIRLSSGVAIYFDLAPTRWRVKS